MLVKKFMLLILYQLKNKMSTCQVKDHYILQDIKNYIQGTCTFFWYFLNFPNSLEQIYQTINSILKRLTTYTVIVFPTLNQSSNSVYFLNN